MFVTKITIGKLAITGTSKSTSSPAIIVLPVYSAARVEMVDAVQVVLYLKVFSSWFNGSYYIFLTLLILGHIAFSQAGAHRI